MPNFGGAGSGYGSAQDTFDAAAGRGGSRTGAGGGPGPSRSDTGTTTDDVYESFVQASQPRGLSAVERAIQNKVQQTKNFLSQPANRRGILGSLLGGLFFGPVGALLGGSLGQRYGGGVQRSVTDFFTGGPNSYGDEIQFTNPRFERQFTMPMNKPDDIPDLTDGGITTLRNSPDISNLVAGLTKTQKTGLDAKKNAVNLGLFSPQEALDSIKIFDDPDDPATLQDVKEYYGII
tara:strand:+ start:901 stop:1602 length:702 start_codon:yes stop_codon:yes gene_type:complete